MAGARIERVGSIFKRVEGLIKGGALERENVPLWFDVYKAFPPRVEPAMNRTVPIGSVRKIIYPEDYIRSAFLKKYKTTGPTNNLHDACNQGPTTHMDRYVKYFMDFAIKYDSLTSEQLQKKVEEALLIDGVKLEQL